MANIITQPPLPKNLFDEKKVQKDSIKKAMGLEKEKKQNPYLTRIFHVSGINLEEIGGFLIFQKRKQKRIKKKGGIGFWYDRICLRYRTTPTSMLPLRG